MIDSSTRVKNFKPLEDYRVNNYIGEQSLYSNLAYIDKPIKVNKLTRRDRQSIFYNLSEVLPKV